MKIKYFIVFALILSLSFSCKIKQNKLKKLELLEKSKLYNNSVKANIDYKSLLVKFNLKYEFQNKSMALKGSAKIKKDSVIIISVIAMLGIEAAKLKFTKDSIFILDKFNGQLKKGSYKFLKKTFNINFNYNDLQNILTNSFFIYPHAKSNKDEFLNNFTYVKDSSKILVNRKLPSYIENNIEFNNFNYKISEYLISDKSYNRFIKLKYENTYSDELKNLPKKLIIFSNNNNKETKIYLNYKKIYRNKQLKYTFTIPKNYKIIKYE